MSPSSNTFNQQSGSNLPSMYFKKATQVQNTSNTIGLIAIAMNALTDLA